MILPLFSVQENVNTCSSIWFLSILNPPSVHKQGVEGEEVPVSMADYLRAAASSDMAGGTFCPQRGEVAAR